MQYESSGRAAVHVTATFCRRGAWSSERCRGQPPDRVESTEMRPTLPLSSCSSRAPGCLCPQRRGPWGSARALGFSAGRHHAEQMHRSEPDSCSAHRSSCSRADTESWQLSPRGDQRGIGVSVCLSISLGVALGGDPIDSKPHSPPTL